MCPLFLLEGGGLWASEQIFEKGDLTTGSQFLDGVTGKEGDDFFQWGCSFYIKNELKSEIFNNKNFFLITKNLNWEVLLKDGIGLKTKNFNIMGVHWNIQFFFFRGGEGEFMKNQYIGEICLKDGGLNSLHI